MMLKKFSIAIAGAGAAIAATLTTVSSASAIVNGSFEAGFNGWITEDLTVPFFPLTVNGAGVSPGFGLFTSAPTDGFLAALHGFDGNGPGTISIAQDVFINSSNTELSFDFRGGWDLLNFAFPTSARIFDVNIEEVGGGSTLLSTNFLMANPQEFVSDTGNLTGSLNLSAFANSSVRISFDWFVPENFTGPAFFQLDNVQLAQEAPEPPEPASIVNGSFEQGFTGWSTIGDTSIEDISFGTTPSDGNFNALMTNGFGAVSDFAIESFLGLTPGTLDSSLNIDATEGSAIKQTFFAKAGDILTFDFNFLTDELTPDFFFNDSSFMSLSSLDVLADTNSSFVFSPISFFEETGYKSFSHTFSESGTYTLGFGVVDAGDTAVDSGLLIDNVELTSVPEPGLIFGLSLIGALGATSLKRKQKEEK